MLIKVDDLILKISKNSLNQQSFWNPHGMFMNILEVKRDETWYKCGISFLENGGRIIARINDLMLTTPNDTITYHERGVYKEVVIGKIKKGVIQYLLNSHSINYAWFRLRKKLYSRRNTIFVFSLSISLAVAYYFGNEYYGGAWQKYIAENSILQALFILLNIFSVGSVFFPFTIQKQLSEKEIRKICHEEADQYDREKEINRRIRERATF